MLKIALLFFCVAGLAGCATHRHYIQPIQTHLERGECPAALEKLEPKSAKEGNDQLLYLMECASALQICGEYRKSAEVFIQADKLSEQIDYLSLSRATAATLLNEQMLQFKGDKFEKLFINALAALNYLQLEENDSAMVEVRRINQKIKAMADQEKTPYQLNSFAAYLAGLIYEVNSQYDDACISYRDSYKIDPQISFVKKDMLTACWRAKRDSEYRELLKTTQATESEIEFSKRKFKKKREIIVLFLQGWGPKKAADPKNPGYARLTPSGSLTRQLSLQLDEAASPVKTEMVYNVEKSAIAALEADLSALTARRFGARVAKEIVADQVRQKDEALGALALVVMLAAERADLRSWGLLPESIQAARIVVTDESKKIKLRGLAFNEVVSEELGEIDLLQNPKKKIYIVRSLK